MLFGSPDELVPEIEMSAARVESLLGEIKRNSRHRRIAIVSTFLLAAAVVSALIAAPPEHGGLALTAEAESTDPQLPRVFGSNGVWRLAEPIEETPVDAGPAAVIEAPTDPDAPSFTLVPPDEEEHHSLPTSTSTPPTSTSGQSPDLAEEVEDPAERDWSKFDTVIRIEPDVEVELIDDAPAAVAESADGTASEDLETADPTTSDQTVADSPVVDSSDSDSAVSGAVADTQSPPEDSSQAHTDDELPTPPEDGIFAVDPQPETNDSAGANPSTPSAGSADNDLQVFSAPASIKVSSVVVRSAHVSVVAEVVDDDSGVIDWCNTRIDWGDGSVTRVAGADDAALCTASCEHSATSPASAISETITFEHTYRQIIDASPRIFVATGDGCSNALAELQLSPFTVVPLGR